MLRLGTRATITYAQCIIATPRLCLTTHRSLIVMQAPSSIIVNRLSSRCLHSVSSREAPQPTHQSEEGTGKSHSNNHHGNGEQDPRKRRMLTLLRDVLATVAGLTGGIALLLLMATKSDPDSILKNILFHVDIRTDKALAEIKRLREESPQLFTVTQGQDISASSLLGMDQTGQFVTNPGVNAPPTVFQLGDVIFTASKMVLHRSRMDKFVDGQWCDYVGVVEDASSGVQEHRLEIRQLAGTKFVPTLEKGFEVLRQYTGKQQALTIAERYDELGYAIEWIVVDQQDRRVASIRYTQERSRPFKYKREVDSLRNHWLAVIAKMQTKSSSSMD